MSMLEDIVFEVLARLPAKDLCRFRCACKGWRALISDPAFHAVQRCHTGPHLIAVFHGAGPPEVRVMDMEGNLIRVFELQVLAKDDGTNFLGVLQQATMRQRLDLICANTDFFIDPAAGRAWTISMDGKLIIGRTALSATFKVMCLEYAFPSPICKVTTIVEGGAEPLTWRQRSTPPLRPSWNSKQRATVNGVVYFMRRLNWDEDYYPASKSGDRIAAFDLESEEWRIINGPALEVQAKSSQITLTELKGTLGVVHCLRSHDLEVTYSNIWLLIDFNRSVWVKEYTIQMPKTWELIKHLGALDDGKLLLLVSEIKEVITKENKVSAHHRVFLVSYNPRTKAFKEIASDAMALYNGSLVLYTRSLLY